MKSVEEIYRQMLSSYGEYTGIEVREGCDLAARMYAVAAQVYGLYVQIQWAARQCFPQTAQGEYLDRHAQLRGLERKQAVQAEGSIRFFVTVAAQTDRVIPAGTVCMTAGLIRFETVEEGLLPAGEMQTDVRARCVEAGSLGNVPAGSVVSLAVAPVGVAGCGNPEAFGGGMDAEEDEALRERVISTFRRLPNGANAAFYQQGALSFEQVAAASVLPRARGKGTVDVVVSTLSGQPGQSLLEELEEYFRQRREIAVDVQVRAPETVEVPVSVKVSCAPGQNPETVYGRVRQALTGWFDGRRLGQNILRAKLGSLIFDCQGVENYELTAPAEDVTVTSSQLPVLSGLSLEEL